MLLFPGSIHASTLTIRGVQYRVFNFYHGEDFLFDKIEELALHALHTTDADEITNEVSLELSQKE